MRTVYIKYAMPGPVLCDAFSHNELRMAGPEHVEIDQQLQAEKKRREFLIDEQGVPSLKRDAAQVAYDTYRESYMAADVHDNPIPTWFHLPATEKDHWRKVASTLLTSMADAVLEMVR